MKTEKIELKASMYMLLTLSIGRESEVELLRYLNEYTEKTGKSILEGASIVLYLRRYKTKSDLQNIIKSIETIGVRVIALSGAVEKDVVEKVGLPFFIKKDNDGVSVADILSKDFKAKVKYHEGNVSSGAFVESPDGDLIIHGDVSHGAKIYARGDIYVFGKMDGCAVAGMAGDRTSKVSASYMNPQLVQIADQMALGYQLEMEFKNNITVKIVKGVIQAD